MATEVNAFVNQHLVPNVKDVTAYGEPVSMIHSHIYYNTVWYGLFIDLVLIAILFALFRNLKIAKKCFGFLYFFSAGIFFSAFVQKYIEQLGRYWVLPFAMVVPVLALFWDEIKNRPKFQRNFLYSAYI